MKYIFIKPGFLNSSTFPHEMGHIFSLLHTHLRNDTYVNPTNENQIDYPYIINPSVNLFPRELTIRIDEPPTSNKEFKFKNCDYAGDLCCDTDATCDDNPGSNFAFPGCYTSGCNYTGTYIDYNNDPITPQTDNFMSYIGCRNDFTDCQDDRTAYSYDVYRQYEFDNTLSINVEDFVEFEGTTSPMKNVTILWSHPNESRYWRSFASSPNGNFDGILYNSQVSADVKKLGSAFISPTQTSPANIGYSYADWIKNVTVYDKVLISKHILGTTPFTTGYKKIAADINKSGSITTYDLTILTKLLLFNITSLPDHTAPWRFVPEFIPQNYSSSFNQNPFSMTINGSFIANAAYTEPSYNFNISNGLGSQSGFDGIKIGDVNGTTEGLEGEEDPPSISYPDIVIEANKEYKVDFKISGFTNVVAWQLGMFINSELIDVLELSSSTLQNFSEVENCGLTELVNNEIRIAYMKQDATSSSLTNGQILFTLKFKANQTNAGLDDILSFSNSIMPCNFYLEDGTLKEVVIGLAVEEIIEERNAVNKNLDKDKPEKLFCYPNPVNESMKIIFESETEGEAAIVFSDLYGKLISKIKVLYENLWVG